MNRRKGKRAMARGAARWQASRLEGVQKNPGIKKTKKAKGERKERRLRKIAMSRASKRHIS